MATNRTSTTVNVKSRLLSDQENEAIFSILGRRCLTFGTTLAELSKAEDAKRETWKKMSSGVVCFVKDFVKRSYFIRLYDPESKAVVWEHDTRLRNPKLQLNTTNDGLLTITVNDHKLSLTDKEEADLFKTVVEEKMGKLQRRRVRTGPPPPLMPRDTDTLGSRGSKKEKKKLTNEDISLPTGFRHVNRVGWDPDTGFNVDKISPEMIALFEQIGIRDHSDVDKETLDFIYDFVDKHGGLEAVHRGIAVPKDNNSVDKISPEMMALFEQIGIRDHSNVDKETLDFIYDFVDKHGGLEAVKQRSESKQRSSVPPPPPPGRSSNPPPPPVNRSAYPRPPPPGRSSNPPPPPVNRSAYPPPPPPGRSSNPPPPPVNRSAYPPPPPPGRTSNPPPPQVKRSTIPPPPPPGRVSRPPPPPVKSSALPPPPSRKQETPLPPPPPLSSEDASSLIPSSPNTNNGEGSTDNPLKQQIMQLLLQNPSEMTDFIFNIIDQKGGLQDIKEALAGRNSQLDPSENDGQVHRNAPSGNISDGATNSTFDDQVPGRTSSSNTSGGASSSAFDGEVSGRMDTDTISGGETCWTTDHDVGSDMLDDDDEEWDD